ncbi:hypothetical protein V5O48_011127 [Marasmius crinis-equi]|uniref:Uncharacterized protein n=1 Tax=Marasmius crinis-equi TaxID=585013 RepID=A0ABR3F6I9_9AGAR
MAYYNHRNHHFSLFRNMLQTYPDYIQNSILLFEGLWDTVGELLAVGNLIIFMLLILLGMFFGMLKLCSWVRWLASRRVRLVESSSIPAVECNNSQVLETTRTEHNVTPNKPPAIVTTVIETRVPSTPSSGGLVRVLSPSFEIAIKIPPQAVEVSEAAESPADSGTPVQSVTTTFLSAQGKVVDGRSTATGFGNDAGGRTSLSPVALAGASHENDGRLDVSTSVSVASASRSDTPNASTSASTNANQCPSGTDLNEHLRQFFNQLMLNGTRRNESVFKEGCPGRDREIGIETAIDHKIGELRARREAEKDVVNNKKFKTAACYEKPATSHYDIKVSTI